MTLKFVKSLVPRKITRRIFLHHTATADRGAETFHRDHLARGWSGIGYNYLIRSNGTIEVGRPHQMIGAHAEGHNHDSIGIALTGNLDKHPPTPAQMQALIGLIQGGLRREYGPLEILGHNSVASTACPGKFFPWVQLRKALKTLPSIDRRVTLVVRGQESDEPAYLIGGTTYIPLRAVARMLGAKPPRWEDGKAYVD